MKNTAEQSRVWVYGGAVLAVLAALYLFGAQKIGTTPVGNAGGGGEVVKQSSALVPKESFYDFGKISMARGVVTKEFLIANTSTEPVALREIWTSCMCTTAQLISGAYEGPIAGMPGHGSVPRLAVTLAPNEEARVIVRFDPAAHGPAGVGLIDRSVYITDGGGGEVELKFRAVVTP